MTTIIDKMNDELLRLWQSRQRVIEEHGQEQRLLAEQRALEDQAREQVLPGLRDQEQDWNQRYDAWLAGGLDLFSERDDLNTRIRLAYGRPRTVALVTLRRQVKRELDRRRALSKTRNREQARKEHARYLRDVAKEQAKGAKSMSGGDGSKYQAMERVKETEAAADRLLGKTPKQADDNAMFIPPEVALRS